MMVGTRIPLKTVHGNSLGVIIKVDGKYMVKITKGAPWRIGKHYPVGNRAKFLASRG